jgi:hypothetical protein
MKVDRQLFLLLCLAILGCQSGPAPAKQPVPEQQTRKETAKPGIPALHEEALPLQEAAAKSEHVSGTSSDPASTAPPIPGPGSVEAVEGAKDTPTDVPVVGIGKPEKEAEPEPVWRAKSAAPKFIVAMEGESPAIFSADRSLLLSLAPKMVLRTVESSRSGGPEREHGVPSFGWSCTSGEDRRWTCKSVAETKGYKVELTYSGLGDSPVINCRVDSLYSQDAYIREESLVYSTGDVGAGSVLGRHQRVVAVKGPYFVDGWTHKVASFGTSSGGSITIDAGLGVQSLLVNEEKGATGTYRVAVELDNAQNHPYALYQECWPKYQSDQEDQVYYQNEWFRPAGTSVTHQFKIVLGEYRSLNLARLPHGFKAAVAFTDHADQSSTRKLAAILYGSSTADPETSTRGFIGHGLGFTKTVFSLPGSGSYSPQLEEGSFYDLLWAGTQRVGTFEVGSHSPSGIRDSVKKPSTLESLERIRSLGTSGGELQPLVWIDHQPSTNCEAIGNLGADPSSSEWFLLDRLVEMGFKYFWEVEDVNTRGHLNLLRPSRPSSRCPIAYRNTRLELAAGAEGPLWLWKSVWVFSKRERFYKMFSRKELQKLVDEEGLHIAHSYLDTFRTRGRTLRKTHLRQEGEALVMNDELDDVLARMAKRQEHGELWVTGVGGLLDHMTALPTITSEYLPHGGVTITNNGETSLEGLTVFVSIEERGYQFRIREQGKLHEIASQQRVDDRLFTWFDLGSGQSVELHLVGTDGLSTSLATPCQLQVEVGG